MNAQIFIAFGTSLRINTEMFSDTIKAKEMFVISAHSWFLKNVVADRTVQIFVDIFLKSTVFVAIFHNCRTKSHSLPLIEHYSTSHYNKNRIRMHEKDLSYIFQSINREQEQSEVLKQFRLGFDLILQ